MKDAYTVKEISRMLGRTVQALYPRVKTEKWPSRPFKGQGGGSEYPYATLPEDIRAAILAADAALAPVSESASPRVPHAKLTPKQRAIALAKADIVRLYAERLAAAEHGRKARAREDFERAYNAGAWPRLAEIVPQVDWKSVERWKVESMRADDALVLADRRGGRSGREVSQAEIDILLAIAKHPNKKPVAECIRDARLAMSERGVAPTCSDATYRRVIQDYIRTANHEWTFIREGKKAWNDKCAFWIPRDYSKIGVGDILVADGHRLNFEAVDPFTGKVARLDLILWFDMASSMPLGWDIALTENTQVIASALRRACLRLGKIPRVAYLDNGRAFKSGYFMGKDFSQEGLAGLFERLGQRSGHGKLSVILAWAYHGQSKTIERFFQTFAELERWIPAYTGTGIESKPPRMMRGEKLHRAVYDKICATSPVGGPLTLEQAHAAIAQWFDRYAARPQRGHLDGRTPLDVFEAGRGPGLSAADQDYLNECMLCSEKRTLHRNGVSLFGADYYNPVLYGRKHDVFVRYDFQDRDSVLIYDENWEYLCRAERVRAVHPAAMILGDAEDQRRLTEAITLKKSQEKAAGTTAREFLERVVIPEDRERLARMRAQTALPQAVAPDRPEAMPLTEVVRLEAVREEGKRRLEAERGQPAYALPSNLIDPLDKYEFLFGVSVRQGLTLSFEDESWMRRFEAAPEYRQNYAARYADLRQIYAGRNRAAQ